MHVNIDGSADCYELITKIRFISASVARIWRYRNLIITITITITNSEIRERT